MQFGVFSLGDHLPNPHTKQYLESQSDRHRFWIELGLEAESNGFCGFWLGEHHFNDYVLSSPEMILAAVAAQTHSIRLGTAVTLLAHHDPVRIAEQFATLDLISQGRAEIGFSSGITPRTYELFGQNPDDAVAIQAEKLELLEALWSQPEVHWRGNHRADFAGGRLEPRTYYNRSLPICVGTGSLDRAITIAKQGHKLMLPSVFGNFAKFKPMVEAYKKAYRDAGHDLSNCEVLAPCYVHVRDDEQDAWETFKPYLRNYRLFVQQLSQTQGLSTRVLDLLKQYNPSDEPKSFRKDCDVVGAPNEVAEQLSQLSDCCGGVDTFMCYFDCGGMAADDVIKNVRLFGQKVIPLLAD